MIKNMWYAILDSGEVFEGRITGVTRLGEKLALWREGDKVHCIADKCCHRGASLSCGKIVDNRIECPFHGFQYDGTGKVKLIPANGKNASVRENYKVKKYNAVDKFGFIWLWWGDERENLPEIEFFDDLKEGWLYSQFVDHWSVHYSRCIENQLDVVHLPFVHKTTIGRGNMKLVNGPVVKRDDVLLRFYVYNQVDDGKTIPLKPEEIKDYEKRFQLQFRYPNIWQNMISDKVRVFAAFVPVDDENSVIYMRFYQRFLKAPLIGQFSAWLGKVFSIVILRQDKRVVITQLPKKSELVMDENLIQGDLPILEYRKYRDYLKKRD